MKSNNYRLTDKILLKISDSTNQTDFGTIIDGNSIQYTQLNGINSDGLTFDFGVNQTKINKVFSSSRLVDVFSLPKVTKRLTNCSLLLKQGFEWTNVFGVNIVIKENGVLNNSVLVSQLFNLNDFKVDYDNSKELIDGLFYTANVNFVIPNFYNELSVCATIVYYNEVDLNSQIVSSYPTDISSFESLISTLPKSSNLDINVEILNDQYIGIDLVTSELNKTVEQSVLDYFEKNELAIVDIEYIIKYGVVSNYKSVKISNYDYKYGNIRTSFDFTEFGDTVIEIFVSCYVNVDGLLMVINKQIIFDFTNSLNPILADIIFTPNTVFPVTVQKINNIQNTIIQQNTEQKYIPILQTVFAQIIIGEEFTFESKNISFPNITPTKTKGAYLVINGDKYITSNVTVDGVLYFRLNDIEPLKNDGTYEIIDIETNTLIQNGKVLIKK